VIVEHDIDCGAWYERKRVALLALLRTLPPDVLERVVPATPAWRVRDVVAHMTGIAADLNAMRFGDDMDVDAWTAAQVDARRDLPFADVVAEWDREAPRFADGLRLLGYEVGSHFLADLLEHSADVDHALGRRASADDDARVAALDFHLDEFHQRLVDAKAAAVRVVITGERGRADDGGRGDGEGRGEACTVGEGETVATLTGSRFELLRAFGGRRSARQLRAMAWEGDPEPVLPYVSAYGVPRDDIVER
jgi:uncharacterized protein (TIGR03083 family)